MGPRGAKGMMRTSVQVPQENTREITNKNIFFFRYRRVPGDTCCGGDPVVTGFLDTHQICKNISWYEYGMNYNYESKSNTHKVSQLT